MKLSTLLILLAGTSCPVTAQPSSAVSAKGFAKLYWLEARWVMINGKPGQTGYENWTRVSAQEMKGLGVRLAGKDTLFVEKLRILVHDGRICYVADVPENQGPVYFTMAEISDHGFVFENQAHDFPKRIAYEFSGGKLKATVSGNGKSIDYYFVRD